MYVGRDAKWTVALEGNISHAIVRAMCDAMLADITLPYSGPCHKPGLVHFLERLVRLLDFVQSQSVGNCETCPHYTAHCPLLRYHILMERLVSPPKSQ